MRLVVHRAHLFGNVGQRQVGQHAVAFIDLVQRGHVLPHPPQVALAQRHGLGRPGGARGVDEGADVFWGEAGQPFAQLALQRRRAHGQELVPARQLAPPEGVQGAVGGLLEGRQQHNRFQVQQIGLDRLHVLQALGVVDEEHAGAAVVEDVGDVLAGAGPVDAGWRGPDGHGGEGHGAPLRAVEAEDGDGVAALHPQLQQRPRGLAHGFTVVLPGRCLPAVGPTHVVGRVGAQAACRVQEHLGWRHEALHRIKVGLCATCAGQAGGQGRVRSLVCQRCLLRFEPLDSVLTLRSIAWRLGETLCRGAEPPLGAADADRQRKSPVTGTGLVGVSARTPPGAFSPELRLVARRAGSPG